MLKVCIFILWTGWRGLAVERNDITFSRSHVGASRAIVGVEPWGMGDLGHTKVSLSLIEYCRPNSFSVLPPVPVNKKYSQRYLPLKMVDFAITSLYWCLFVSL